MWVLARLGFHTCVHMLQIHACVSSHSQIQLITWKTFHGDAAESPPMEARGEPRWLMGDVVGRKSRHTRYVWKQKPSTGKPRGVLRQSLNCNENKAPLFSLVFLKVVRSGWSRAVVGWGKDAICWSTAGITTQEEKKRKRGGGGEVLCSHDSPAIWAALRDEHKENNTHASLEQHNIQHNTAGVAHTLMKSRMTDLIMSGRHLWRVKTTCDCVMMEAGMRSRVAQAGRHHQQSTEKDRSEWI